MTLETKFLTGLRSYPQPVRAALRLEPGGETDDPFRTFREWGWEAETKARAGP